MTKKERESLEFIRDHDGSCTGISCLNCHNMELCRYDMPPSDVKLNIAKQKLKECDDMTYVENICNEVVKRVIKEHPEWVEKEQPKEVPFHVGGVYENCNGRTRIIVSDGENNMFTIISGDCTPINNTLYDKDGVIKEINKEKKYTYKRQLSDIITEALNAKK